MGGSARTALCGGERASPITKPQKKGVNGGRQKKKRILLRTEREKRGLQAIVPWKGKRVLSRL